MKKLTRKNKILFSAIVSFCVALSLVFPTFAYTPTVYQMSNFETASESTDDGFTRYYYDISSAQYYNNLLFHNSASPTTLYSDYRFNARNYPIGATWNAYSEGTINGYAPPLFNFGSFTGGNTVTLSMTFKLNNIANIQQAFTAFLFLSPTWIDYDDIITCYYDTTPQYVSVDTTSPYYVSSVIVPLNDIQGTETYTTISFDFNIDTFTGNLFPVIAFDIGNSISGWLQSMSVDISRTYPTSGIILENTEEIKDAIDDTNENLVTMIGDLSIIKGTLDTVKSTLSTISSRINTTNTRLNTLHNDITNLHNDLFNGETVEFNSSETLAPEDIEDAHENIDYSKSAFQDFFGEWFTNTDLLPWFAQMWSTLLDDSGVGTPFFLLFPSALLLLVRSLFGR